MTGAGTDGGSGGQGPPEGTDPDDAEKCPICLNVLSGVELAMPDSCCHVFCLRCLVTWAELQVTPSCPVDRRPFTNVYRWDGYLSCVQVPLRRRVVQPEVESYCRRNSYYKTGLNCKKVLRQKKMERTVDKKSKGLVRKCNDEDPSSLTRKKVRGAESCSWSPPAFVSLTTTHEIAQTAKDEEVMLGHTVQLCKRQSCVWFSQTAPLSTGSTRESFHSSVLNTRTFPFASGSSSFFSSSVSGSSHFVFEGVMCAITCPKGGEKKGGRNTKAAPKQAAAKRNSTRGAKTQETAPLSDPQTSGHSDSDTPHSAPTRPTRGAQAAGKRKGKQVTNRKASGKRKAPTRKKRSAEVISSSEEEEDTTKSEKDQDEQDVRKPESPDSKEDEKKNGDEADGEHSEPTVEESLDKNNSSPQSDQEDKPLINDSSDTQDKHESEAEEKTEGPLSPLNAALNSPTSTNEDNQSVKEEKEEEEEAAEEEKKTAASPKQELEDSNSENEKEDLSKQEEMDISDAEEEKESRTESVEKTEITQDDTGKDQMEENDSDNSVQDECPSPRQSEAVSESADGASQVEGEKPAEKDAEKDLKSSTEDLNEVPMDFGSPMSEPGSLTPPEKEVTETSQDEPKVDISKSEEKKSEEKKEKSPERSRPRRSRFHSPTTSWSPKRESKDSKQRERDKRSRSRERNGSPARRRSRDRERDGGDYHRRERDRERSRERSRERRRRRSRSRSRSRSRNRSYRRGDRSPEREERREERRDDRRDERREERKDDRREERRDERREESPQMNDRRGGWRSGGEVRKYGGGRFENGLQNDDSPERNVMDSNPDWVEKQRSSMASSAAPRWEEQPRGRGRGGRGGFDRGRGRGAGNRNFHNQDEQGENRWQPRNNFSGTGGGNMAGGDAYSRFNENRGGRRKEVDSGDAMDRSGWSSASSWAVRRTLPADVQDYYSKRERGGPSGWNRQEEETTPTTDTPKTEAAAPTVLGNAPVPVLVSPHPQLLHHYPALPGARGPVSMSLQPAAPYALPPSQLPMHLHTAAPLLQVPAAGAQGLPPPPPPPPPMMQQGSQTAVQPDGHNTQVVGNMGGFTKPLFAPPIKVTPVTPVLTQALPSSTTQPQHNRAQADSSKKEKKQQIQEQAINEVKNAMKPYYQKKEITKEEYKEIVRKAVEKVCHSKSGEVNSSKVANLVKAYVDKYKHARKK